MPARRRASSHLATRLVVACEQRVVRVLMAVEDLVNRVPEGCTRGAARSHSAAPVLVRARNRRFLAMMLCFGIAFEVLLLIMLNLAGILTHEGFRKWRRVMIFALFVIVGMANPNPDPITMLILGGLARPWSRRPSSSCGRMTAAGPGSTRTHMRACPTTSCPDRARRHGNPAAGLTDGRGCALRLHPSCGSE